MLLYGFIQVKKVVGDILQSPDWRNFFLGCLGAFFAQAFRLRKFIPPFRDKSLPRSKISWPYLFLSFFIVIGGGTLAFLIFYTLDKFMHLQSFYIGLSSETLIAERIKKVAED